MADLLTPGEVLGLLLRRRSTSRQTVEDFARLRRNYLTLWDRNKVLEDIADHQNTELVRLWKRETELETTIGWYEEKHPND